MIKMILSKGKIRLNGIEQNVKSIDVAYTDTGSRSNWGREGIYVNETINSVEVNFETNTTDFDNLKPNDEVQLYFDDGAIGITGPFKVSTKWNPLKGITFMSFMPMVTVKVKDEEYPAQFTYTVVGGGSGGTTDYNDLDNKPTINKQILAGDKSLDQLGIQEKLTYNSIIPANGIDFGDDIVLNVEALEYLESAIKEVSDLAESKQDKLVAGQNITIEGNVISATGGGSGDLPPAPKEEGTYVLKCTVEKDVPTYSWIKYELN